MRKIMVKQWCSKIFCSKILFQLQQCYVSTYTQKHQETENRFCFRDTPKRNSVSVSKTLQNGIPFPYPRHFEMEFCFHFRDTPKRNSISVSGLHYSINPKPPSVMMKCGLQGVTLLLILLFSCHSPRSSGKGSAVLLNRFSTMSLSILVLFKRVSFTHCSYEWNYS